MLNPKMSAKMCRKKVFQFSDFFLKISQTEPGIWVLCFYESYDFHSQPHVQKCHLGFF